MKPAFLLMCAALAFGQDTPVKESAYTKTFKLCMTNEAKKIPHTQWTDAEANRRATALALKLTLQAADKCFAEAEKVKSNIKRSQHDHRSNPNHHIVGTAHRP